MTPLTSADLLRHRLLESLGGSPDHDLLVFIMAKADAKADTYRSSCWLLRPGEGTRARRLTAPAFDAKSPSLAPDGRTVAFISTRNPDNGPELHTIPVDGGEAMPLGRLEGKPKKIQAWSPDGKSLLVTVAVKWAEDEFDDTEAPERSRPLVAGFLPYKSDGTDPQVGHRVQLVSVSVEDGSVRTLVSGDFNVEEAQYSPDGTRLAFVRNRTGAQRHLTDLWVAYADGGNAVRLTHDVASVSGPRWSPDGKTIAFAGSRLEGDSIANLWLCDAAGGELRRPAGDGLQLEGQWVVWHPDGTRIATIGARDGLHEVAVVEVASGRVRPMHGGMRHIHALCQAGDRLLCVPASIRRLDEIESVHWDGSDRRRHTGFNRWFLKHPRPRAIKRRFLVPDGDGGQEKIDAWLLLPPAGKGPFPLLMDMHGGPQSVTLVSYADHAYWYALCARGWAIVAPNAVGSGSYGPEFARRLVGRWGELDLPQHLAILDRLQQEGIADLRVACTGKSYGGYLSAWAIGQSSRFTSAVVSAPVVNIESHYGTSDSGYYVTPYAMGGEVREADERYHRLSPIRCCGHSRAATLILQGQDDERCPLGQAEELFANLVRCGSAPCKMVVYPGGSHGLAASGKPSHRVNYHQRLAAWVQQWSAEDEASARAVAPAQATANSDS